MGQVERFPGRLEERVARLHSCGEVAPSDLDSLLGNVRKLCHVWPGEGVTVLGGGQVGDRVGNLCRPAQVAQSCHDLAVRRLEKFRLLVKVGVRHGVCRCWFGMVLVCFWYAYGMLLVWL